MLSSVLRSERAIQVNIAIMRTFVQLRQMLASNAVLTRKLTTTENRLGKILDTLPFLDYAWLVTVKGYESITTH